MKMSFTFRKLNLFRAFIYLIYFTSALGWFSFLIPPAEVKAATPPLPHEGIQEIDQLGGEAKFVFQYEQYVVIGRTGVTDIYDASDRTAPTKVSKIANFTAEASVGSYLYGYNRDTQSWIIWNISNPLSPLKVGAFEAPADLQTTTPTHFVFRHLNTVILYNIQNPHTPQRVGQWKLPWNNQSWINSIIAVGEILLVGSDYEYCIRGACQTVHNPLQILDTSSSGNPILMGEGDRSLSIPQPYATSHNLLYWLDGRTLEIWQVAQTPPGLVLLHSLTFREEFYPRDVTVNDTTLYIANKYETKIFDVSTPTAPVQLGTQSEAIAGEVYGNTLFGLPFYTLAYNGIAQVIEMPYIPLFDVTNPTAPTLLTTIYHPAGEHAAKGTTPYLYLLDATSFDRFQAVLDPYQLYLHTVDITNPTQPRLQRTDLLGSFDDAYPQDVQVVNDEYLYIYQSGEATQRLEIYQLPTDTTPPIFVRSLMIDPIAQMVVFPNALVTRFGTAGGGLDVYDLTDPVNPQFATHLNLGGEITAEGNYGYFVVNSAWFRTIIMDFSVPEAPVMVANHEIPTGMRQGIGVRNRHLYFYGEEGLSVLNFSTFDSPIFNTNPDLVPPFLGGNFYTEGNRLYFVTFDNGFEVQSYRLDNPTIPLPSGRLHRAASSLYDAVFLAEGENSYLVDTIYGLRTLGFTELQHQYIPMSYYYRLP